MLVNLNDVLLDAQKKGYAVGLFNTTDTDMLEAAIRVAESLRSPIIIGTAEVLLPYGELELLAPALKEQAEHASVPVVLHYDHGLTFDRCIEALHLGFTSVMFDGSQHPYEENLATTREMVKIAHAFGATVEGEIGHVGLAEANDNATSDRYTTVEEAVDFYENTGVDALAIAIGTAHGAYKTAPKLDLERLAQIRQALPIPLVLHGGSGLSDDDFRNAIRNGISKINIYTDLCLAGEQALKEGIEEGLSYLPLREKKVKAICRAVCKKIKLFGSAGQV